jgi:hypothetical protein
MTNFRILQSEFKDAGDLYILEEVIGLLEVISKPLRRGSGERRVHEEGYTREPLTKNQGF